MAAEAAVYSAVLKLGDLLMQKANFLRDNVAGEVQHLKDELQGVQCFLRDEAGTKARHEIRAVAHDAADAVDVFCYKVERARIILWNFAFAATHMCHLIKFSRAIKSIRKRLHEIEGRCMNYRMQDLGDSKVESSKRPEQPVRRLVEWQKDKHVVGMKNDVELLLEKAIMDERDVLSIASVVGVAGIGKSTLARIVQNHAAVANRFDCRAWAVASKKLNPGDIIKELLLQVATPMEIHRIAQFPNLLELLCQRLQGKRYFIVLDDVSDDAHWDAIASAFPDEGNGSRLLLTSRSHVLNDYTTYVHTMKCLDPYESWRLFLKTVSVDGEDLEDIGRQIVNKCNGLPFAISLVGGLLMKLRQSKNEWEKLLEEMSSHFDTCRNDTMKAVLELSFQKLPPELKSCFLLSLGCFKEIRSQKLVDVWIAEGFIPQKGEKTKEETAMSYLDELVDRSMVQIKELAIDGRIKRCQMHEILRDLFITKGEEEISLEILHEDGKAESSYKPRHRVLHCSQRRFNDTIYGNKHIQSLFVLGGPPYLYSPSFSSYWMSFQLLRVLDFEDCKALTRLPAALNTLIGLRFLSLRNTDLWHLPYWLPRLKNLEVLDLRGTRPVEVNYVLGKMCSLRHLYTSEFCFHYPINISNLKLLQTLSYVNVMDSDIEQLTSLCKLCINMSRPSNTTSLNSLNKLEKLVHLKLKYSSSLDLERLGSLHRITRLELNGALHCLPDELPPNLSHLSLNRTLLREDPMPLLQKLPKLLYLKMKSAYDGAEMVISHDGFPDVDHIALNYLERLDHSKAA